MFFQAITSGQLDLAQTWPGLLLPTAMHLCANSLVAWNGGFGGNGCVSRGLPFAASQPSTDICPCLHACRLIPRNVVPPILAMPNLALTLR